jgi:hypothetical protein
MTDCPNCEYHKNRAARWRAEAYKLVGHEIELPWVGLTEEEIRTTDHHMVEGAYHYSFKQGALWAENKLKEKNT